MLQSYKNHLMKRKDLTVVSLKLLKDKKINHIYFSFREKISSFIGKERFAIAVSGGSDSLALSVLAKLYSLENDNAFVSLIIDHKLRKESAEEARVTYKNLTQNKIKAKILTYQGEKFSSNIQKKARDLRYDLFHKYCAKNKIKFLILAHHQDDLIENFYIRLIRGSGIKGLTSLQNIFEYSKDFYLLRPLLNFNKQELLSVTKKSYSSWIEDPSNKNDKFLRVRIRKMQTKLQKEGFDPKRIIKTIDNLNTVKDSLDFYIFKSEKKYLNFYKEGYATLKSSIFNNEAQEVIFRVIIKAIHFVSGEYYPPRSDSLKGLMKNLLAKSFKSSTLGGCLIEKNKNIISFYREDRNVAVETLNKTKQKTNWDDRFLVNKNFNNQQQFVVKKLGNHGIEYLRKNKFNDYGNKIPVHAKKTLPSFWNNEGQLLFVPFVNFKNKKYNIKNDSFSVSFLRFI
ncbi:tilS tRNA(Ile)-lysidine synthase [Candidatus Pelagibacterales bacterium]